jgi:HEAT repeat protein
VLIELVANPEPRVRAHAIEAMVLGMRGQAEPQIVAALGDSASLVRFAAAMAAGELKLESAREPLLDLVNDANPSVQVAAKFALHRLGDASRSHDLEVAIRSPEARVRGDTAIALGRLGEPTALPLLRSLHSDPDPAIRLQAAEARWVLADEQAAAVLITGTVSVHPDDQIMSVLALAMPRDRRVMEHVRSRLASEYVEVALAAARALGMLGSDEGYGLAVREMASEDPRRRLLAALALGAIGRADSQELLAKGLDDTDSHVRLSAAGAILQLKPA